MTDIYTLPCSQRANFATAARLLSCLVTESLVQAFYVPMKGYNDKSITGLTVVINAQASASGITSTRELFRNDVLAIVPLKNAPIFKPDAQQTERGTPVGLLDPLDMYPCIFTIQTYDFEADNSLVCLDDFCLVLGETNIRPARRVDRADAFCPIWIGHAEHEHLYVDRCGCPLGSLRAQPRSR